VNSFTQFTCLLIYRLHCSPSVSFVVLTQVSLSITDTKRDVARTRQNREVWLCRAAEDRHLGLLECDVHSCARVDVSLCLLQIFARLLATVGDWWHARARAIFHRSRNPFHGRRIHLNRPKRTRQCYEGNFTFLIYP